MRGAASNCGAQPVVEALEGRTLLSVSPSLQGQHELPTRTVLTVDAGMLGQPITFDAIVYSPQGGEPLGPVDLYYRGKLLQELHGSPIASPNPKFSVASEATFTVPAGPAGADMFGIGLHAVRAYSVGELYYEGSVAVATFRVKRPQFTPLSDGVKVATVNAGSGPALQPGDTATIQYNAYLAATYRMFSTAESQTPDSQTFTVDASPEQVIPGLDAGVIGMQAGETRAIYIPYALAYGKKGAGHVPPRANVVFLVTLVSIG